MIVLLISGEFAVLLSLNSENKTLVATLFADSIGCINIKVANPVLVYRFLTWSRKVSADIN
jgi:hypothetical protein